MLGRATSGHDEILAGCGFDSAEVNDGDVVSFFLLDAFDNQVDELVLRVTHLFAFVLITIAAPRRISESQQGEITLQRYNDFSNLESRRS